MDGKRIAGDAGRSFALGAIAHTLSVEASLTQSVVAPFPVRLTPEFRLYDASLTFTRSVQRRVIRAERRVGWCVRRLILPVSELVDWQRAEAFLAGLAGCDGPMCLEVIARRANATFYLGAPAEGMSSLSTACLATFPESALVDAPDPWHEFPMDDLVLCDLFSPAPYHRSLRTSPGISWWSHLLRLCERLTGDQVLFCQIIFTPAHGAWHQNIAALLEAERSLGHRAPYGRTSAPKNVAEPFFAAVIRIGATMPSLRPLLETVAGLFTVDGKPFGYRTMDDFRHILTHDQIIEMLSLRTTHTTGQLFNSSELARFLHFPDRAIGNLVRLPFLSGLSVPDRLRTPGTPLGTNNDRGVAISVFQPARQANRCTWSIGISRKGKSSSMVHKARFLANSGEGLCFIDPHRTACFELLGVLDEVDRERVMFLDFDAPTPVAYNAFADANEEDYGRLTTEYLHSLKHLFESSGFHRMNHLLGNALYALFVLKENLATLPALFAKSATGEQLRRRVIALAKNDAVCRFFAEEYPQYSQEAFAPISNRFSALFLDDKTARTFSRRENRVDIATAMDDGRIVVVAPPASFDAASIVGGILIAQIKNAAFHRAGTDRATHLFTVFVDETQRFITSGNTVESLINESSKGGLAVALANQETGQVPSELLKALYSIPNILIYGVNLLDAKQLAHLFNGTVAPETLASLGTGDVYARIEQDIVNFHCPPPLVPNKDLADRLIAHSYATYYTTATKQAAPRRTPRRIDTLTQE